MGNNTERRLFFKYIFSSASSLLNTVVSLGQHDHELYDNAIMASDITGDLTPELLDMEAQRLGLDPQKDQKLVYQAIQAAMGRPDIKNKSV